MVSQGHYDSIKSNTSRQCLAETLTLIRIVLVATKCKSVLHLCKELQSVVFLVLNEHVDSLPPRLSWKGVIDL